MPSDRKAVQRLAVEGALATEPELGFSTLAFDETLDEALSGRLTCFVAEERGELIGLLLCEIGGFAFASGVSAHLRVIWVTPDRRGTRAAADLMQAFCDWSEIVGARKLYFGIDNSPTPGRTIRFFERFGARVVGVNLVAY